MVTALYDGYTTLALTDYYVCGNTTAYVICLR